MTSIEYPIARYQLNVTMLSPIKLPFFSGSMLRGALGHSLRKVSCITHKKSCLNCPVVTSCPYPEIYEPTAKPAEAVSGYTQLPALYVIEPPQCGEKTLHTGETFSFNMVLMGKALKQLPLIIFAWQKALQKGLTPQQSKAQLTKVAHENDEGFKPVWSIDQTQLEEHNQLISLPTLNTEKISLELHTPTRLQRRGKPVGPDKLNARDLLAPLLRRQQLFSQLTAGETAQTIRQQIDNTDINLEHQLKWVDWTRYSNRQQQKMALGGIMGKLTLQGDLAPYSQPLALGQWLHVGKNTTFGMGRYTVYPQA